MGLWGPIYEIADYCHSQNKYWHFGLVFQTNSQAHFALMSLWSLLHFFFLDYNLKNELLHSNCVTMSITTTSHCNLFNPIHYRVLLLKPTEIMAMIQWSPKTPNMKNVWKTHFSFPLWDSRKTRILDSASILHELGMRLTYELSYMCSQNSWC